MTIVQWVNKIISKHYPFELCRITDYDDENDEAELDTTNDIDRNSVTAQNDDDDVENDDKDSIISSLESTHSEQDSWSTMDEDDGTEDNEVPTRLVEEKGTFYVVIVRLLRSFMYMYKPRFS